MNLGLIVIATSIVWYIVHAVIYNYYLQKYNPGLLDDLPQQGVGQKGKKRVSVVVTSGVTPAWVMILGMPPIPLFFLGIVITIVAFIVGLFT